MEKILSSILRYIYINFPIIFESKRNKIIALALLFYSLIFLLIILNKICGKLSNIIDKMR